MGKESETKQEVMVQILNGEHFIYPWKSYKDTTISYSIQKKSIN